MNILRNLNPEQRQAVTDTQGPVLVLAGAGSGKTRVLTHKVAYILEQNLARPYEILAVTFTNKAAKEMRARIEKLVAGDLNTMAVGTFHSIFARILRQYASRLNYSSNFTIYDREDQERLMKEVLREFPGLDVAHTYKAATHKISSLKSKLIYPAPNSETFNFVLDLRQLYDAYEKKMKANNALDFDDLLLKPLQLFQEFSDICDLYRQRFRYILVDEYQDTNIAQNELIKILWTKHKNLTVVGDDDQSIYGWRGAELGNILNFQSDFPDAKIYRLEQNYRSTDLILNVAQSVIDHNLSRHSKTLWTKRKGELKPVVFRSADPQQEAVDIVSTIAQLKDSGIKPSDIAVLYRTNAQSRSLEMVLREYNLPYTIVGGYKFYQRKEIKDILSYLKLMINPDDAVSINRIINFPPRGLGETTLNNISNYSRARKVSLWQALLEVEKIESIRPSICAKLNKFTQLIQDFQSQSRNLSFPELVKLILEKSGIKEYYLQDGSEEALDRLDNLREFQTGAEEYAKNFPDRNLEDFLQEVTLISDIDEWEQGELVNLMTVHSAKGLEFPTVFICGLEEGLFPLIREGRVDIEEERRLFYVGATRAMDRLYLSCANYRQLGMFATPSRFLGEIPLQLLDLTRTGGLRQLSIDRQEQFRSRYPSDITFPSASPKSRFSAFKRGDKVLHKKFGEGVISACEGEGEDKMVMVYFQGYGAKKLMLKFAGLEKISYED